MTSLDAEVAARAAEALRRARVLIVSAGAGMGVDSGLPDFRGDEGFWKAYPPVRAARALLRGRRQPGALRARPGLRLGLLRPPPEPLPRHRAARAASRILRRWIDALGLEAWVVTSNVDGQFQRAGFPRDRVLEVHGSIHHLQCLSPCSGAIWENREEVPIDEERMRARRIPRCKRCPGVARPNILMFGDYGWLPERTHAQRGRFDAFLEEHQGEPLAVVELGAGTAIPTIRLLSERLGDVEGAAVVRINPREADIRRPHLSLAAGALEGLRAIDTALG